MLIVGLTRREQEQRTVGDFVVREGVEAFVVVVVDFARLVLVVENEFAVFVPLGRDEYQVEFVHIRTLRIRIALEECVQDFLLHLCDRVAV